MEPLERECHEWFCWSPISVRQSMCVEIEISKPSASKGQQNSAQGFNPGLGYDKRCALKALPTPRTRGAIPNWRSTPILQYSITPRGQIRGRGRRRGRERSDSRVLTDQKRTKVEAGSPFLMPLDGCSKQSLKHFFLQPPNQRKCIQQIQDRGMIFLDHEVGRFYNLGKMALGIA